MILVVMLSVIGIWNVKSFLLSIITFVCICELNFFVAAICKGYDISFYKKNLLHRKEFIAIEIIVLFINLGIIGTFFGVLNENSAGSYGNVLLIMIMILSMLFSVITLIFFMAIANVREHRMIHEINQRQLEGQKRHYEQLREYMTGQFSEVQKVISTGSNIVDAILNDKFRECEDECRKWQI